MSRCPERPAEILLVEDDPGEVLLGKKSFEKTGFCNKIRVAGEAMEDISDTYEEYANSYVTKPGNFHEFIKTIKTIEDFWFSVVKLPCREVGWRPYSRGNNHAESASHRR